MSPEVPKSFVIENTNIIKEKAARLAEAANSLRTDEPVHGKARGKTGGSLDPSKCWVCEK